MSDQFDNTNRGALFKNDKRKETHADYRGTINVGGVEYYLDAWIKKSKAGATYMSLSCKPKQDRSPTGGRNDPDPELDDDLSGIPF